jgi:WD40 repeat protein
MLLASASESVLVWDASTMARPQRRTTTHGDSLVRSVRWDARNAALASSGDDGSVCLGSNAGARDLMASEPDTSGAVSLSLAFDGGSRLLAAGGDDGVVRVWDLALGGHARRVHGHTAAVSCVCWAPAAPRDDDDGAPAGAPPSQLLTAGSELGEVTTHAFGGGERAPVCVSRLVIAPGQSAVGCTAVEYSPLRSAVLATADSAGAVRLWDVGAAREGGAAAAVHMFGEHSHACAGLAWSAVNHLLLASAGRDGKLAFYDTATHVAVKRVSLPEALSCVAFLADGVTIAVGTEEGSLHVFDLRMSLQPMRSALASERGCAISAIAFQHPHAARPTPAPPAAREAAEARAETAAERRDGGGAEPLARPRGAVPTERPGAHVRARAEPRRLPHDAADADDDDRGGGGAHRGPVAAAAAVAARAPLRAVQSAAEARAAPASPTPEQRKAARADARLADEPGAHERRAGAGAPQPQPPPLSNSIRPDAARAARGSLAQPPPETPLARAALNLAQPLAADAARGAAPPPAHPAVHETPWLVATEASARRGHSPHLLSPQLGSDDGGGRGTAERSIPHMPRFGSAGGAARDAPSASPAPSPGEGASDAEPRARHAGDMVR